MSNFEHFKNFENQLSRNDLLKLTGGSMICPSDQCTNDSDCPQSGSTCGTYECDDDKHYKQCTPGNGYYISS
jgi:hypothetical protein